MKFALVNGEKTEATKGAKGFCPSCRSELIAKCGEVKINHWAHKGSRNCDPWWENETEWHRAWKGHFPIAWQEVVHRDKSGEKHIADVKTDQGWVIEFQHSYLKPEERRVRDGFYQKLVWVVDGARRKSDRTQFLNVLNKSKPVGANPEIRRALTDNCALLREWAGTNAPVFFDFGEKAIWWLLSKNPNGPMYVAPFSCTDFIEIHCGGPSRMAQDFEGFVKDLSKYIANYESHFRAQVLKPTRHRPLRGFQQHLARRNKSRRRF